MAYDPHRQRRTVPDSLREILRVSANGGIKQDTIIKDKKSNSKTTIIRIDEDGNTQEEVYEEGDNLADFDFDFEPIVLDMPFDFAMPMPPLAIDVPSFHDLAPSIFLSPDAFPSLQFVPDQFQLDTIPGVFYRSRSNDDEWKEFSKEFEKKFREEFGDFYKKNEKEFEKMMKEMETNFEKRYEERELAQEYLQESMYARRELMEAQQQAHQSRDQAMQQARELQEVAVAARSVDATAVIEAQRAIEAQAAAMHEVAANVNEVAREAHIAQGNMKRFERSLRVMLIEDGYINSTDEIKSFKREQNGAMEVNGKKIKESDQEKYNTLHQKHFKPGFHYWNVE
jgi:hypothetical protein